jgi:predicted MPP superfamily phosphohydrolase
LVAGYLGPTARPWPGYGLDRDGKNAIQVSEKPALTLSLNGRRSWLAELINQLALTQGQGICQDVDALEGTLAQNADDASVDLLAHVPDIIPKLPETVVLTLSGHRHCDQHRLFGWSPKVPWRYRKRLAYGNGPAGRRDLVVSGGIGGSLAPVQFGVTPEITLEAAV